VSLEKIRKVAPNGKEVLNNINLGMYLVRVARAADGSLLLGTAIYPTGVLFLVQQASALALACRCPADVTLLLG
jgi:hypothetical protein